MSKAVRSLRRLGLSTLAGICILNPVRLAAHDSHLEAPKLAEDVAAQDIPTFAAPSLRPSLALERFRGDESRAQQRPALSRFLARYGTDWEIRWDQKSDRPHLLQGPGIPLLPTGGFSSQASGKTDPLTLQQVEAQARPFLAEVSDLLRIDPDDLILDRQHSLVTGSDQHLWLLEFQQTHAGLVVEGARVFLRISHGRIIQFGTEGVADIFLDVQPWIAQQDALPRALAGLAIDSKELAASAMPELKIFPTTENGTVGHRLAWDVKARGGEEGTDYRVRIDAHTGEVLEVTDLRVFGEAKAKVHGLMATTPVSQPLPYLRVNNQGLQLTGEDGSFIYQGGQASASLRGALVSVTDECGPVELSSWNGVLDFGGSSGTDCAAGADGGPGNTQAARDAYYHLTQAYATVAERYPRLPLPTPLIAKTNQSDMDCEAFWNESEGTFFFGQSGAGCSNSAEVPGIVLHEVGHAADSLLGGTASDGASGEAQADFFAFLETGDTCIGRGLRPTLPCFNCDTLCTGVREIGDFASGGNAPIASPGSLEAADGLACDRYQCPFPGGPAFQGPLGYQAHCESQIASSAMLDLHQLLTNVRQQTEGRQTVENLWYSSLPAFGQAYRRVAPWPLCSAKDAAADGCGASNWYSVLLAADDDDGDLSNGTPNGCLIWQAFDTHGIACGESPECYCKNGGGLADAGPDVQICQGESTLLGSSNLPGIPEDLDPQQQQSFLWSPGGETTARIMVSPSNSTNYTLTVEDDCGTTYDEVSVEVVACNGFNEDFENGGQGWQMSGLWHATEDSECIWPPAAAGQGAMYFGVDGLCSIDIGRPTSGDLTSPPILIRSEKDVLTFDSFLSDSEFGDAFGRVEVAVKVDDKPGWEPRWAVRIQDLTSNVWETSSEISLAAYQGSNIRLRFRFESYELEGRANDYLGWLVDNVRVFETVDLPSNTPPTVTLVNAPTQPISQCECVRCRFLALDAEDGDLTEILAWSSDLDGDLGSAGRPALILSPGDHILTGTVTDYGGYSASLSIPVQVYADPSGNCGLEEWPPAEIRLHCGDGEEE